MVTIKKEYENTIVGFNGSGLPLGKRKDLDILFGIAQKSGNKELLKLFEEIPTPKDAEAKKVDSFLKKTEK